MSPERIAINFLMKEYDLQEWQVVEIMHHNDSQGSQEWTNGVIDLILSNAVYYDYYEDYLRYLGVYKKCLLPK